MTRKIDELATYIIHYSPLRERAECLTSSIAWGLLKPRFITEHSALTHPLWRQYKDASCIEVKSETMAQVSTISQILCHHASLLSNGEYIITQPKQESRFQGITDYQVQLFYKQALEAHSLKNLELTLQHLIALEEFTASSYTYCLILEDDSVCRDEDEIMLLLNLSKHLQAIDVSRPCYYDVSDSMGMTPDYTQSSKNNPFIQMRNGQTRCASSYIVNRPAARILTKKKEAIVLPVDWHYSYVLRINNIATWWAHNPIFSQGSQSNYFESNQAKRNS